MSNVQKRLVLFYDHSYQYILFSNSWHINVHHLEIKERENGYITHVYCRLIREMLEDPILLQ